MNCSFLKELCESPKLNDFISELAGGRVLPHPMRFYQGHVNLKPEQASEDVDKWHTDTVALDFVLLATDPSQFQGGHFEYLKCTKGQAIRSLIREEWEPQVVKVKFPAAGYAVLQQGNLVVHRASQVTEGHERTTLVQSYIPDQAEFTDVSKLALCVAISKLYMVFFNVRA